MKCPTALLSVCLLLCCSTSQGQFTSIINVPPDSSPASIGSDTQLNLSDSGTIPADFEAGASDGSSRNVEVNITGGTVEHHFFSYAGSTIYVSGGAIASRFWPHTGSTANISGGSFSGDFTLGNGSVTNIFGGVIENELHALLRSTVNVWGGDIAFFQAHEQAEASFFGREFFLDGVEMTQLTVGQPFTIPDRDVLFSGTLADGTPFSHSLISAHPDQQGPDTDHFAFESILNVILVPTADFDYDGDADGNDLAMWEASYGVDNLADADGDGDSDGADFLAWQQQYTGSLALSVVSAAVPEPNLLILLCSGLLPALHRSGRLISFAG